jgi:hypothetical protein
MSSSILRSVAWSVWSCRLRLTVFGLWYGLSRVMRIGSVVVRARLLGFSSVLFVGPGGVDVPKDKWDLWGGGGRVRDGAEDRVKEVWNEWVRDCETVGGTLPCSGAQFPGPRAALADLVQMVRITSGFAAMARRAYRLLYRDCRAEPPC